MKRDQRAPPAFGADEVEELRDLITWVDVHRLLAGAFTATTYSVFLEGGAAAVSRIMHVGYRNGACCRRRPVVSLEDLDCCEANQVVIRAATTAEAAMATVQAERPSLILLDLDGTRTQPFEVAASARKRQRTPLRAHARIRVARPRSRNSGGAGARNRACPGSKCLRRRTDGHSGTAGGRLR